MRAFLMASCVFFSHAFSSGAPARAACAPRRAPALRSSADDDDAPPRPSLDALGERLRARRAANDFLEVAKNDGIVSEEEVAAKREAAQEEEVAPKEYDPDASRFGNWFDVLRK
mmetsp:Transcript_8458/g.26791  ORF Transcript_8458/g.26791 Transcript_8458/m.26791 type:complete len:114 (-) Transcript_8458:54-395(-)